MSKAAGGLSHPVAGGVKPQILRRIKNSKVISKLDDVTDVLILGNSLVH
jgi:hypothetical protein